MKKTIVIIILILISYYIISINSNKILAIPDNAIRLRIIANSNDSNDQKMKKIVKNEVQSYLAKSLQKVDNIEVSRSVISSNIDDIRNKIGSIFTKEHYNLPYDVNFGLNYFPDKKYKGINYDAGQYESLVITIGKGAGDNWWCVLFPPLCLLEAEENSQIEYTSFVKEMLDKYV